VAYSERGIHGFQNLYEHGPGRLFAGVGEYKQKDVTFWDRSKVKINVLTEGGRVVKLELFCGETEFRVGKESPDCQKASAFVTARKQFALQGVLVQQPGLEELFLGGIGPFYGY
jgi:hypothetical protein